MNRRNFIARAFGALASLALVPKLIAGAYERIYTPISDRSDYITEMHRVECTNRSSLESEISPIGYRIMLRIEDSKHRKQLMLQSQIFELESSEKMAQKQMSKLAEDAINLRIENLQHDQQS